MSVQIGVWVITTVFILGGIKQAIALHDRFTRPDPPSPYVVREEFQELRQDVRNLRDQLSQVHGELRAVHKQLTRGDCP